MVPPCEPWVPTHGRRRRVLQFLGSRVSHLPGKYDDHVLYRKGRSTSAPYILKTEDPLASGGPCVSSPVCTTSGPKTSKR